MRIFVFSLMSLAACIYYSGNANAFSQNDQSYTLKDCAVKLNLLWEDGFNLSSKTIVMDEVGNSINIILSRKIFPAFSAHKTSSNDYYMFYFLDKCEHRKKFINDMINDYFINIKNFPKYNIEIDNITPGFDGVTPSGNWSDQ